MRVLRALALLLAVAASAAAGRPHLDGARPQASVHHDGVPALASLQRTTVVQFPLVASGVKAAYPKAAGPAVTGAASLCSARSC